MSWLNDILKLFGVVGDFLNTATFFYFLIGIVALTTIGIAFWISVKPEFTVLYASPEEAKGEFRQVTRTTPSHIFTKEKNDEILRFIRFKDAVPFRRGLKTITYWWGRRGTAYTKGLDSDTTGKTFTLWDCMISVWGQDTCDALQDDLKQNLIKSEIPITIQIDPDFTPEGYEPKSELFITEEADQEMAKLFGLNVARGIFKEDWVRTLAILIAGVGLAYILQGIGILAPMKG